MKKLSFPHIMFKKVISVIMMLFFCFPLITNAQWIQQYPYGYSRYHNSIELGSGNGYLTLGSDTIDYAYHFDLNGNLLSKTNLDNYVNSSYPNFLHEFHRYGNNKFLFVAITDSMNLIYTDSLANLISAHSFHFPNSNCVSKFDVTADEKCAFVGYNANASKLVVYVTDGNGLLSWADSLPFQYSYGYPYDIIATQDSGVAITYFSSSLNFAKYDKAGNLLVNKIISPNSVTSYICDFYPGKRIDHYKNNGFIVAYNFTLNSTVYNTTLKLNSTGDTLVSKTSSGYINGLLNSVMALGNGDIAILGTDTTLGEGPFKNVLALVDSNLNFKWVQKYDYPNVQLNPTVYGTGGRTIIGTSDGGFLITGFNGDFIWFMNGLLIKTDLNGESYTSANINQSDMKDQISFYPNPANEEIILSSKKTNESYSVNVFDVLGRNILSRKYFSGELMKINTSEFENGIYFLSVQLISGKTFLQNKIIVQH